MNSLKRILPNRDYVLICTTRTNRISIPPSVEESLNEEPRPIIWDNDGQHGIIEVQRVRNDMKFRSELRKANVYLASLEYRWAEVTIPFEPSLPVTYFATTEDRTKKKHQ